MYNGCRYPLHPYVGVSWWGVVVSACVVPVCVCACGRGCGRAYACVWARARTCVGVGLYVSVSVSVVGSCFVDCCMVQLLYMQPCEYVVAAWTLWRGGFL